MCVPKCQKHRLLPCKNLNRQTIYHVDCWSPSWFIPLRVCTSGVVNFSLLNNFIEAYFLLFLLLSVTAGMTYREKLRVESSAVLVRKIPLLRVLNQVEDLK